MNEFEAIALAAAAKKRKQEAAAQMTAGGNQKQPRSSAGDTEAKRKKLRLLQEQARVKAPTLQKSGSAPQSLMSDKKDDAVPTYEELIAKARELDAAGDTAGAKRLAQIAISRRDQMKPAQAANTTGQVFEIQANDGTVYEVQAANIEQAAATVNGLGSKDKPWGQVLKENLIGDNDPTTQNFGEKVGSFLNKAGESFFLGAVGDETSAALESFVPGVDYEQRRDHYRAQEQKFEEQHPLASFIAELAPLAVPATGLANAATRGTNLGLATLRGGALAGAQGAAYGFAEGEGGFENRLDDAKTAGALSAGMGALAAPIANKAQNFVDGLSVQSQVRDLVKGAPSADDLSARAKTMYQRGQARGRILGAQEAKTLADDVRQTLMQEGVMRSDKSLITRDPDVKRILDELDDLEQFGLAGNQVKPVREIFSAAAKDRNPTRARIGRIILNKYDKAVSDIAPEFRHGDQLYTRAKKTQAVDQLIDVADNSDAANAMRREFQKVDRRHIKGENTPLGKMNDDEVAAMQRVARGTGSERLARKIGTAAPTSVSDLMFKSTPPVLAGSVAGDPVLWALISGATMGTGAIAKAVSNRSQSKYADLVRALMATGSSMPVSRMTDTTQLIVNALAAKAAPRLGEMMAR